MFTAHIFSCMSRLQDFAFFQNKFNNVEDVDTVFWKFNFWRHRKLVGAGQYIACDWRVGAGPIFARSHRVTEKMTHTNISGPRKNLLSISIIEGQLIR